MLQLVCSLFGHFSPVAPSIPARYGQPHTGHGETFLFPRMHDVPETLRKGILDEALHIGLAVCVVKVQDDDEGFELILKRVVR